MALLCMTAFCLQVLDEAKDSVTCLRVCAHEVLTACLDGRIRRYDLRMGQMIVDFIGSKTCACIFHTSASYYNSVAGQQ